MRNSVIFGFLQAGVEVSSLVMIAEWPSHHALVRAFDTVFTAPEYSWGNLTTATVSMPSATLRHGPSPPT